MMEGYIGKSWQTTLLMSSLELRCLRREEVPSSVVNNPQGKTELFGSLML